MSPLSRSFVLATVLSFSLGGLSSVGAQTNLPAPGAPAGIPPAPKGHRQPTASDVPSDDSAKGGSPSGQTPGLSPAQKADDEKARKIIGGVCSDC